MRDDDDSLRAYYDAFAPVYELHRDGHDPSGYHDFVDEQEADLVRRYGEGRDVLEVGCGTGLVLRRIAAFARAARGVDLSPGMLARARARGLDVGEAPATALPFPDASFDVVCSFKVLPHVPEVEGALAEMLRVTRPGGHVVAELYNPRSFRGLAKHLLPAGLTGARQHESDVYTRFDSPARARALAPPGARVVGARGIRILVPGAFALRRKGLRELLLGVERRVCDGPLAAFGGFYAVVFRKDG